MRLFCFIVFVVVDVVFVVVFVVDFVLDVYIDCGGVQSQNRVKPNSIELS